jgi:protein tyrosine phosphatase (PTP) superfamily phosphohydrolase (DUF442 family)
MPETIADAKYIRHYAEASSQQGVLFVLSDVLQNYGRTHNRSLKLSASHYLYIMSAIYNFKQVSDLLACSGQPTESQLTGITNDDYHVVINLGLADGKYALADEAASANNLGLTYHHIPVVFDNPQMDELTSFIRLMNEHSHRKTLVHCAANYRASAFTGLYLFAADILNQDEMQEFIEDVWQPDGIWQQFIDEAVEVLKS